MYFTMKTDASTGKHINIGSLVEIKGGPITYIGKIGVLVFYDSQHCDIPIFIQEEEILSYKVLIDEELVWFARHELEKL